MTEEHPWTKLPIVDNDTVSKLITLINTKEITPKGLYTFFHLSNLYLLAEQLRHIQHGCSNLYSHYNIWYGYDHSICCRVVDRWNLKPRYRAEGYYYCTKNYIHTNPVPPYGWDPMNQQLEASWFF
jgi:hypothetical protein